LKRKKFNNVASNRDLVAGLERLNSTWVICENGRNLDVLIIGDACLCDPDSEHRVGYCAVKIIISGLGKKFGINGFLKPKPLCDFISNPETDIKNFVALCTDLAPEPPVNGSFDIAVVYDPHPLSLSKTEGVV